MLSTIRKLLLAVTLLFCYSLLANETAAELPHSTTATADAVAELIDKANHLKLYNDSKWHALLHYRKHSLLNTDSVKSAAISPSFFLSPNGSVDPQSELEATLRAFFLPLDENPNEHPQCRFQARYLWLQKQLHWNPGPHALTDRCNEFQAWSRNNNIHSVSLVFATGYMSNPASLYGHMLIKFNSPPQQQYSTLLDASISFGALVPQGESGLAYITRGLFGGYEAGFSHDRFFQHNHGYAEEELRDLWEYELNLSQYQVDLLVAHSWELKGIRFDYLFLSDNCATQVSEFLQLVLDSSLLPPTPWSIPSSMLFGLNEMDHSLVRSVKCIPSRQNRFYEKYHALNAIEKSIVKEHIHGKNIKDIDSYNTLDDVSQAAVIETLFDYYEFRISASSDKKIFRQRKQELILARVKLPPSAEKASASIAPADTAPPHQGNPPFLLQITAIHNTELSDGAELRIRPAYYDQLSLGAGRLPNSSLAMADLKVKVFGDNVFLHSFDLVSLESLNISRTGLPGDGGAAWSLRTGLEQDSLACTGCRIFQLEGGIGKAIAITDSLSSYAMFDARLQSNNDRDENLATGAHAGFIFSYHDQLATSLSVGHRSYLNGEYSDRTVARFEARYGSDNRWDIRLRYEKNQASEFGIALSAYW